MSMRIGADRGHRSVAPAVRAWGKTFSFFVRVNFYFRFSNFHACTPGLNELTESYESIAASPCERKCCRKDNHSSLIDNVESKKFLHCIFVWFSGRRNEVKTEGLQKVGLCGTPADTSAGNQPGAPACPEVETNKNTIHFSVFCYIGNSSNPQKQIN